MSNGIRIFRPFYISLDNAYPNSRLRSTSPRLSAHEEADPAHNELSRLTQDALRTASGPLTSAEIAAAIMQTKEMPANDAALKEIVATRALAAAAQTRDHGKAWHKSRCPMGASAG